MANVLQSNDSTAPVSDPALPKNPFADTQTAGPSEPTSSDITKSADAPASTANGSAASTAHTTNGDGVNGSGAKGESAVSDITKPASDPTAAVMTGALPLSGDQSNATSSLSNAPESAEKDGVEHVTGANAVPGQAATAQSEGIKDTGSTAATGSNGAEKNDTSISSGPATEDKPSATGSTTAPTEKQDVEMKDAALASTSGILSAPAPASSAVTTPIPDVAGLGGATQAPTTTPALATPATAAAEVPGDKRKAEDADVSEPAAKKQKGAFSKAVDKAKDAVQDMKEKAKPGRKPGKKGKKETAPPPVGRTERKTRSQARTE